MGENWVFENGGKGMKLLAILAIILMVGNLGADNPFFEGGPLCEIDMETGEKIKCWYEPNIVCNYAGCFDHNVAGERIFYKNNHKFSYDPATDILKMLPCRYSVRVIAYASLGEEQITIYDIYDCGEMRNHE